MIELVDTLPDINVQPAEYKRLLGYPRERVLSGRARELAEWARAWYAKHGRAGACFDPCGHGGARRDLRRIFGLGDDGNQARLCIDLAADAFDAGRKDRRTILQHMELHGFTGVN